MMGMHFMGDVPFRTVYIHGLVRDERGQKMSKSKGNVIDPLELIDRYGADALRFTICALTGPGRDVKLGAARVEGYRSFVTKLWNAARFCEMNGMRAGSGFDPAQRDTAADPLDPGRREHRGRRGDRGTGGVSLRRIRRRRAIVSSGTRSATGSWNSPSRCWPSRRRGGAAEMRATAAYVLGMILRLLHPVMPFVTEELWDQFGYGAPCSLIRAAWPEPVAGAGCRGGARGARLGGAADQRGARRARGDERAAGARAPVLLRDAAPETLARAERWMRGDPPPGARLRGARAGRARCRKARRRRCWTRRRWCCRWPGLIDLDGGARAADARARQGRRRRWRRWRRSWPTPISWPRAGGGGDGEPRAAGGVRRPRWRGWRRRCAGSDRLASNRTPIGWARAAAARHEFALCARTEFR